MVQTLVPVDEYLTTTYRPDLDFVEGRLEERNLGEKEHGKLQLQIAILLKRQRKMVPFIETRLKISASRYRVPDVCAYYNEPDESIFTKPPVLCVEILSTEDRMSRLMKVVQDYLTMGVPTVWMLDPLLKRAYLADTKDGFREVADHLAAADGRVALTLNDIFSEEEGL